MGDVSKKNFLKIFLSNKVYFPQTDIFWTLSWPFSCDYNFWLRDLKFGMCNKDPINKTCWKNGKDLSNAAPKIKLWNHTKKTHFPVFAKNFRRPCMKLKIFFANFQILGPLGCQGWLVIPQNVKNHCTLRGVLIYRLIFAHFFIYYRKPFLIYVWLRNRSHRNFLIYEENFVFFLSMHRQVVGVAFFTIHNCIVDAVCLLLLSSLTLLILYLCVMDILCL
jgi:hypothetical protein